MSAMPIGLEDNTVIEGARIKVIGVGGGGNNAVDRMIEAGVTKAEFICVNTDAQQLANVKAKTVLQIGAKLTNGLGAGAKPETGRQAAEETKDEIKNLVKDADMVFVTAGMGGGTGTGAAPIIAEAAKSAGILTVAVVTKPFAFEGPQRMRNAEEGIKNLAERVDSIVTIPNDLLLKIADKKVTINDSFKLADDILRQGIQGIIDIITQKGIVNCDFADVRTIMKDSGVAHMGIGIGKGENAAQDAVRAAIESPLLETSIAGAENVLLNITGGTEFSLVDMGEVSSIIKDMVSDEATIIVGSAMDETMKDEIKVTLIATSLDGSIKRNADAGVAAKKSTSTYSSERRQPSYSSSVSDYDDDSIFKRRLRPGMSEIDVPGFFKR
ncbi:MAG: cell division protein FtsZ [Clostridia bacterium]|nr:cell division protein FtsZ [Clostridia bacterium]